MIVFFSVSPVGEMHMGEAVADAVKVVEESGLDHQVTAMGTLLEGEWDEVMGVVRRAVEAVHRHSPRVTCLVKIDSFQGRTGALEDKLQSVESALGRKVRR